MHPKTLLVAAAVSVLLIAGWLLPIREWTLRLANDVKGAGLAGVLLFVTAYVVSTVALLPGSLLTLAAGFAYGPVDGLLVASPASVAGATLAFVLGRTLFSDWAARRVRNSPQTKAISRAVSREGFKLVLLLRLSPLVPFNLLNYILSLSDITLGRYVLASFIGMLPVTWLYVYLGSLATAAADLSSVAHERSLLRTMLYVAGLAATAAVAFVTTRTAKRALAQELRTS